MSTFDDLRAQLAGHRDEHDVRRTEALLAADAARRAEQRLEEGSRSAGDDELGRLQAERDAARRAAAAAGDRLTATVKAGLALDEQFAAFSDPREGVARLTDEHPILLFPLRLETRFKPGPAGQPQLWLRIYPDTCLVDGFEASLTDAEVENGTAFWAAIWRAGGDEPLERAAWRELVAAAGTGRAGWIVRTLVPTNPADAPERLDPSDVFLVVAANAPLPPAVADHWTRVWRAGDDRTELDAAHAALEAAIGADAAADVVAHRRPFNLDDAPVPPATRSSVRVETVVLQIPSVDDLATRRSAWSSPPRVDLLPERFVVLGYEGGSTVPLVHVGGAVAPVLITGPDPNAPPDEQLKPVGDTLQIPDDLAWMFDFERALSVGMAVRFDLTPAQQANGFTRVLVLGVRLADGPENGRAGLERLLEHHLYSREGLEVLQQGTPTNSTEQGGAGYSWRDDPDESFSVHFRQEPQFVHEPDPLLRADGQWLAHGLGLPESLVSRIPGAGQADRSEAHAMQIALWPATLGYLMDTLLAPVFPDEAVRETRGFFTRHVTGRGPLPAVRIGRQPYGIQPVADFSHLSWFRQDGDRRGVGFPGRLYPVLRRVEEDWRPLVAGVSRIGQTTGDPHQVLLDVLGLHATSAEYYPLGADSLEHKTHEIAFLDASLALTVFAMFPLQLPITLLRSFGYTGDEVPELLTKIYRARQTPLDGPLVDDRPLSEADAIHATAGGRNYIGWLIDAAGRGMAALQQEDGFDADTPPAALLYLMLRHALQLSFRETAIVLAVRAGIIADVAALRREPPFVHVKEVADASESRYAALFSPATVITGEPDLLLGDYIAARSRLVEGPLPDHLAALDRLSDLPTARLERLFAEHVDSVSYRFDAWKTGLLAWGLERLRAAQRDRDGDDGDDGEDGDGGEDGERKGGGLHLGAYGWLENLRSEDKDLRPAKLPADVAAEIDKGATQPLMEDPTNLGLVHAPSIGHATTAAVLRNAHLAHEGRLSVNLSSRRVRNALAVLEGMRGGQSLGALLGYQFERHVHDHGPLTVRDLVYPLRRAFPLAANQIQKTATDDGAAKESIAAMNVVDGRKLVEHVTRTGDATYPFGVATLPRRSPSEEAAITAALVHITDVNDAVADLVLSEGVYQAVTGNFERSAGTLDAFAKGNYPVEPDVVRTPRSGITLTLRTAVHLPPAGPAPTIPATPLAIAEPNLDRWLQSRLPHPDEVGAGVTFTDRATGDETTVVVTQSQLGLRPIDLLYRLDARPDHALGDLDDRILDRLYATHAPRHDRPITIAHTERIAGLVTWFELEGLLRSLRRIVVGARPLRPADLVRQADATSGDQATSVLDRERVQTAVTDLDTVHLPALGALATNIATAALDVDAVIASFTGTIGRLSAYRIPQSGTGSAWEWRATTYAALVRRMGALADAWTDRLARHDALVAELPTLPPTATDEERIQLLHTAEVLISTVVTQPDVAPTPADLLAALGPKRVAFEAKRDALREKVAVARATLRQLVDDVEAELPLDAFDPQPFDLAAERDEISRFRAELAQRVTALVEDVTARVAAGNDALSRHDAAVDAARVDILQAGAKAIFGDDMLLVPSITLTGPAAAELANAAAHTAAGELLKYLTDPVGSGGRGRDLPVDDWMHGVARVREKMHHWENVVLLCDALPDAEEPVLTPLQLPHAADGRWLALEFPPEPEPGDSTGVSRLATEHLLYTADLGAGPFDPSQPVCGLLVDEWTEVIPGRHETTGVAFHHDRPNAEPPQAWLLALPASADGRWTWDELVGAVNDALDSAKMRAIEPTHVDGTAYSALLPATHSPWTFPEISISNNFLRNVRIYSTVVLEG